MEQAARAGTVLEVPGGDYIFSNLSLIVAAPSSGFELLAQPGTGPVCPQISFRYGTARLGSKLLGYGVGVGACSFYFEMTHCTLCSIPMRASFASTRRLSAFALLKPVFTCDHT